jgi:hypothetical protein
MVQDGISHIKRIPSSLGPLELQLSHIILAPPAKSAHIQSTSQTSSSMDPVPLSAALSQSQPSPSQHAFPQQCKPTNHPTFVPLHPKPTHQFSIDLSTPTKIRLTATLRPHKAGSGIYTASLRQNRKRSGIKHLQWMHAHILGHVCRFLYQVQTHSVHVHIPCTLTTIAYPTSNRPSTQP